MKTKAFPIAWKRLFDYNKLIHRMHPDCLQAGDHSMRVVHLLDFIRMQMADGIDQMVTLHQMQKLE